MHSIRLKFLGAIGTVTGSCTLIEYNKTNYYLVDAGMYQGESDSEFVEIREKVLKKYIHKIEIIFLTHAHLDHIGLLPKLIDWEYDGSIFGTKATIELTKIMLDDLIRINKDHDPKNVKKMNFYAIDENHGTNCFMGFGKNFFPLTENLRVTFLRTSHILGSCSYLFHYTEEESGNLSSIAKKSIRNLYFTGDIGSVTDNFKPNILFKEHQLPFDNEYKTFVMESTYGMEPRKKRNYAEKHQRFSDIIQTAIDNGKTIIIPAFALDRAQQILVDLSNIFYSLHKKQLLNLYNKILKYKADNKENGITDVFNYIPTEEFSKQVQSKIYKDIKFLLNKPNNILTSFPNEIQQEIKSFKETNVSICIHSPLIRKVNKIYIEYLIEEFYSEKKSKRSYKYLSDIFLQEFGVEGTVSPEQKKEIQNRIKGCLNKQDESGRIIVSASGMCDEGPVLDLLKRHLVDENAIIILTGYSAHNTNGYLLKKFLKGEFDENNLEEKILLNNTNLKLADIKCEIIDMSEYYSGHADQEQLVNYIANSEYNKGLISTKVFLNHGVNKARDGLKSAIEEMKNNKIAVSLPKFNVWYDIISGEEDSSEEFESDEIKSAYESKHCRSLSIGGIEMYVPIEYNEKKLRKIIEFIKNC